MEIRLMDLEDALYVYGHPGEYSDDVMRQAEVMIAQEPHRTVRTLRHNRGGKGMAELTERVVAGMRREIAHLSDGSLPRCFSTRRASLENAVSSLS